MSHQNVATEKMSKMDRLDKYLRCGYHCAQVIFAREVLTEEHWVQVRPVKVFSRCLSPIGSNVLGPCKTFEVVAALEDCSPIRYQFQHHVGVSLQ